MLFYFAPFFIEKSLYSVEIPSLNVVNKKTSDNNYFMTWNMIYKYKINKRWTINYVASLRDISKWFARNDYRFRFGEFNIHYLGVINKSSKPIGIMPNVGLLKNSYWMPFNTIQNNFNFSELTNLRIDSENIRFSIIERNYSFKVGVDFNFVINTSHPNRHVKFGIYYSNPIFYSGKKVKIEEIEGKWLKFNKSFEISIDDPRIRTTGSDKFRDFPATIWCHLSYNWGF